MPPPNPPQPERKPAPAAGKSKPLATPKVPTSARDTQRPTDSTPMQSGNFAKLPMRFGRYLVERLLGRGAMGSVYLARDTQLDRLVALKIPKLGSAASPKLLLRLKTEATAAAQLDHPCVCPVFDAGEIDEIPFIAMKYIEGETLKDHLQKNPLTLVEAIELVRHLAEGLAEAHAKGIYHRDLKPENIKLDRRGQPVIMDFGLAKLSTLTNNASATQTGSILGSPAYMSPEQAGGQVSEIDHRSDIYALGVILFELLTGAWPFTGPSLQVMGQKSLLDPPSPTALKPELPPGLAAVCQRMIARKRENRFQSAADLIEALRGADIALPGSPVGHEGPGTGDQGPEEDEPKTLTEVLGRNNPLRESRRIFAAAGAWLIKAGPGVWTAIAASFLFFGIWASGILKVQTREGLLTIEVNEPDAEVLVDGEKVSVTWEKGRQTAQVSVKPGQREIRVTKDGFSVDGRTLTLSAGPNPIFHARLEPKSAETPAARGTASKETAPKETGPSANLESAPPTTKAAAPPTVTKTTVAAANPEPNAKKTAAPPPDSQGGIPLFNGKDLTGWKKHPTQPGNWRVEDGILTCDGDNVQELYTEREDFSNFHLRMEVRFGAGMVHMSFRRSSAEDRARPLSRGATSFGYGVVLSNTARPFHPTGSLHLGSTTNVVEAPEHVALGNRWIPLEVIADGQHIVLKVDGRQTVDYVDEKNLFSSGGFALKKTGARSGEFRNIEIRELSPPSKTAGAPFVPLLVGSDLTGWETHPMDPGAWRIDEGVLEGPGSGQSWLYTVREDFADLHLKAEVRIGEGSQFALGLRTAFGVAPRRENRPVGLVVAIRSGGADGEGSANLFAADQPVSARDVRMPPSQWAALEVSAVGQRVTVKLDGQVVADGVDEQRRVSRGRIALGIGAKSDVRFRKFEVRELPAQPLPEVTTTPGLTVIRGFPKNVWGVALSPVAKYLLVSSQDATVRLYEAETGREIRKLFVGEHESAMAAFSPDGSMMAACGNVGTVFLWGSKSGREIRRLDVPGDRIHALEFSPDGRLIAAGTQSGKKVHVWDAQSGAPRGVLAGHTNLVREIAFLPDGERVASAGWDNTVRIWDIAKGSELQKIDGRGSIAFDPGGELLAIGDRSAKVRFWSVPQGKELRTLSGPAMGPVRRVAFSPNGKLLATSCDNAAVTLWDLAAGRVAAELPGRENGVNVDFFRFSGDGTRLVGAGSDKAVRIWTVPQGLAADSPKKD